MKKLLVTVVLVVVLVLGTATTGFAAQLPGNWSAVGGVPELTWECICLLTVDGRLYAGTDVDGVWAWDGSAWSRVGNLTGKASQIYSLTTVNGAVYAGTGDGIWAWDGAAWSQAGDFRRAVWSLATIHDAVYAGTVDSGVWAWDGSAWSRVGSLTEDTVVYSLATVNGAVYAGTGDGVLAWNGSGWFPVGNLTGDAAVVSNLAVVNGTLYAGTLGDVWTWDGSAWSRVGNLTGDAALIHCLALVDGVLYAGTGNGVWVWDGSTWSQVGAGVYPGNAVQAFSLAATGGKIYAGTKIGVWAWDVANWTRVSAGGLPGYAAWAMSLATANGALYTGTWDGGVWVWDGTAWSLVGGRAVDTANISALITFDGKLYAGTWSGVLVWDGAAWSQAGSLTGDADWINSLSTFNGKLHAGTENGVWVWDGATWSLVGNLPGYAARVYSLAAAGNTLYAGTGAGVWSFTLPASPGGDSGGGRGSSKAPGPVHSITGSAVVYPSAGGTVGLGSDASITIPPGALQGSTGVDVAIRRVASPPPAPVGYTITGAYEFTVNGLDHYTFNKPVTLTFTFDPAKVAKGTTPAVYYYNGEEWVLLTGAVDWTGNTITVTVDHFSIYAVMAKVPAPAPVLNDIAGHWAQAVIEKLVSLGAISGYPDGSFRPDQNITRAEFVSVLVRAFQLEPAKGKVFADTAGHWAGEAISTAASYGIVAGYSDGRFGPDDLITREQMAAMTVKAAELNPVSGELAFTDSSDISPWAKVPVITAVKNGIIKGYLDNTLRPGAMATRAEAAAVVVRAIEARGANHQQ